MTPRQRTRFKVAPVVLTALIFSTAAASPPQGTRHGPTPGVERPAVQGLVPLGPTPAATTVSLTLLLHFPGIAELQHYIDAQQRAATPDWLTPSQIGERFGLPTDRLDAVVIRLARAGVTVTERFEQRTALLAQASAGAVERLFHVRLQEFRASDGTRVRVPSPSPQIPAELANAISQVQGLDTRPVLRAAGPRPPPRTTKKQPTTPGFLQPRQLAHDYGADPLSRAGIDGRGEIVAIASLATLHSTEVQVWAKHFHTRTAPDQEITVAPGAPTSSEPGWDADAAIEVALDLEMVRALAPGATLLNYTTSNDSAGLDRIVNQVTQDHRATILTTSWGRCELAEGPAAIQNSEATYAAAQATGIDVFAASGDVGPYDCNDQNGDTTNRFLSVDYPASSAYVIGVGGTTLLVRGNKLSEAAWQEPLGVVGSGGGLSVFVSRPSWQLDGVVHDASLARAVPDVAGPASDVLNLEIGVWAKGAVVATIAGGTSAATPFWAGATALAKQYLRAHLGRFPDGNLKTLLYVIASRPAAYAAAFHDIRTGSNQLYAAGPGWDFLTGLGSPNISGLASQLSALVERR